MSPSTRGSLPNPYAGGAVKQAVLNQVFGPKLPPSLDVSLPELVSAQPAMTLGRSVPIPKLKAERGVPLASLIFSGNPVCIVVVPSMPQPDMILSANPLTLLMYRLPL